MDCEICQLLGNDKSLVFETDFWKVFAINEQSYLGRCVVSCKRHCFSLSELKNEEWNDFHSVVKKLEAAAKKAFGASLANWACLMNNAFRKDPGNPHVHWHFRPRYRKPVVFAGKTFTDPDFGEHYGHHDDVVSDEILSQIVVALKSALEN